MGTNDVIVNQWLGDEARFADLFNGFLFSGEQIIRPEELEPCDSRSQILLPDAASKEKSANSARSAQRFRDVVKRWNRGIDLSILACENQDKVHYAMPVRTMIYDGMTYHDQIRALQAKHKQDSPETADASSAPSKPTREEFLSGFRKDDKLIPCITLVFYYDEETWDGPLDLYDMFRIDPVFQGNKILKKYVPGYRINLIDAGNISQLERFHTDLQQIFGVLKYRGKKEEIQQYIYDNSDYFQYIDKESYEALRIFMHSEKMLRNVDELKSRKEGTVDMCQALQELYQDGVETGRQEGFESGQKQQTISIIINMLNMNLSLPVIKASTMASDEILAEAQELYRKEHRES